MEDSVDIPASEKEICLRVLQRLSEDPALINDDERFKALVAKIHRAGKKGARRSRAEQRQAEDRQIKAETGLVQSHRAAVRPSEGPESIGSTWGTLKTPESCYVCKQGYTRLHPWYHLLCPDCAALHAAKRLQRTDLAGRTALVTGGRIKIGFQLVLRLLRDGSRVIVTTRFPADAARRFAAEADAENWRERLRIDGLDLRHLPTVERFAQDLLETEPALDILVNNAAQTIKRPLAFYQHLLAGEQTSLETSALAPANSAVSSAVSLADFPPGCYDQDGQQQDLRAANSWRMRLDEVPLREMLEVQLVNAAAPFLLNSRLKPLLMRSPHTRRFIINVSAMEGQFARPSKTIFHPHTNMAKAALNMMTRTSAADYARDGIYMNSVDTGWVTDENPHPQKRRAQEERGFWTPLDIIDGMARLYDPIVQGLKQEAEPPHGHFLKDFAPHPW